MYKILCIIFLSVLFIGCTQVEYRDVYIPTKCEIPERIKPNKSDFKDFTDFSAHLRAYYKNIESDLYFCRTGNKKEE